VTSRLAAAQHQRDLAPLRRVRDQIDREHAEPMMACTPELLHDR